jgi:hypothetical protein
MGAGAARDDTERCIDRGEDLAVARGKHGSVFRASLPLVAFEQAALVGMTRVRERDPYYRAWDHDRRERPG